MHKNKINLVYFSISLAIFIILQNCTSEGKNSYLCNTNCLKLVGTIREKNNYKLSNVDCKIELCKGIPHLNCDKLENWSIQTDSMGYFSIYTTNIDSLNSSNYLKVAFNKEHHLGLTYNIVGNQIGSVLSGDSIVFSPRLARSAQLDLTLKSIEKIEKIRLKFENSANGQGVLEESRLWYDLVPSGVVDTLFEINIESSVSIRLTCTYLKNGNEYTKDVDLYLPHATSFPITINL